MCRTARIVHTLEAGWKLPSTLDKCLCTAPICSAKHGWPWQDPTFVNAKIVSPANALPLGGCQLLILFPSSIPCAWVVSIARSRHGRFSSCIVGVDLGVDLS